MSKPFYISQCVHLIILLLHFGILRKCHQTSCWDGWFILIKIQFVTIIGLKSSKFYKWSENHVEAHSSQIIFFFKCFALNHDHQMSRSCLNMRSSIQNYKHELMNNFLSSMLHQT